MERQYAVEMWRDKLSAYRSGKPEGYFVCKTRYATQEAAQSAANYHNSFSPVCPSRVVRLGTHA